MIIEERRAREGIQRGAQFARARGGWKRVEWIWLSELGVVEMGVVYIHIHVEVFVV